MTVQEEAQWCIQNDGMLAEIRKKIRRGKATYADTAAYSARAGKMIGALLSRRLPEIPLEEREQLCVDLLRGQYIDINAAVDAAQSYMDKALGIHLTPQHPSFNAERAHQIGSATADTTVPQETQQRRARSATENAVKSMHDDRMKSEADFRSRAGLKCYITRKAVSGCCPWCTAMAGRYEYGEEPHDVYRRHDNCDCTVTYENGRQRQDVWSKRTWEVPGKDAGAAEPTVLTAEQAAEIEAKHQPTVLTGGQKHDRIKLGINLFDSSDELYVEAYSVEEEAGFTDIYVHGSPSSIQITVNGKPKNLTPAEFEQLLKSRGINGGDIRLCSCSTGYGDDSFAQKLSEIHKGIVKAPDSDVYYAPDEGTVFIGDPNANVGKWRLFEKGAEIYD